MSRSLLVTALAASLFAAGAQAHEYHVGQLDIGHPWTRATAKGQPSAVGFLTIENQGDQPDTLLSATSPAAADTQIHSMTMEEGVMKMRPAEGGVPLPPGELVKLQPNGLHLMLIGLKEPFKEGQRIPLTLTFAHAGQVQVELAVDKAGAQTPGGAPDAGGHGHDHGAGQDPNLNETGKAP